MGSVDLLTDARSRGVAWSPIAEALIELTKSGSLDPEGRPWIEVAAHLSGYSTNYLRIGLRTYTSIKKIIDANELPSHALHWPLSNLEVITRIATANLNQAKEILSSTDQESWRSLRKIYEKIRNESDSSISAMSAAQQSARSFKQKLFVNLSSKNILRQTLRLSAKTEIRSLKTWPRTHQFVHPDFFVEVLDESGVRLIAFEGLRFYGNLTSQEATRAALKAAVEATFFTSYYWCVPVWVSIKNLEQTKKHLGLANVGIIALDVNGLTTSVAPDGDPMPDRRTLLLNDGLIYKDLS